MGTMETVSSWDKIRLGVGDAERLLGQERYNLVMIEYRQTSEIMVRSLADKACMVGAGLSVTTDDLRQGEWISRMTCDYYHKIRMVGNKAVHEGSDSAHDADQAFHLLPQGIYTLSNDYKVSRPKTHKSATSSGASASRGWRGSRRNKKGFSLSQADILQILVGVLCIIFITVSVNFLRPGKKKDVDVTIPVTTGETSPESTPSEAMAETTPAPVYETSTVLNARAEPSITATIRGQFQPDTIVDCVGQRGDEWSIITYEGQQSYMATQCLVHD